MRHLTKTVVLFRATIEMMMTIGVTGTPVGRLQHRRGRSGQAGAPAAAAAGAATAGLPCPRRRGRKQDAGLAGPAVGSAPAGSRRDADHLASTMKTETRQQLGGGGCHWHAPWGRGLASEEGDSPSVARSAGPPTLLHTAMGSCAGSVSNVGVADGSLGSSFKNTAGYTKCNGSTKPTNWN